jgi:hypothetical protein
LNCLFSRTIGRNAKIKTLLQIKWYVFCHPFPITFLRT